MSDAHETRERCTAVKKDGSVCGAPVIDRMAQRCIGHRVGADVARSRGGSATSRAARAERLLPARLGPVLEILEQALKDCYTGDLPASRASAMASVASAIVKVLTSGELEERLRELEQRVSGEHQ